MWPRPRSRWRCGQPARPGREPMMRSLSAIWLNVSVNSNRHSLCWRRPGESICRWSRRWLPPSCRSWQSIPGKRVISTKATGKLAKTDRIDARVLAHVAEAVRPEVRTLPDAATREMAVLVARRRQLMEMRVAEQNRSRGTPARIRSQIREHVEWLNRQIDELDHEIGHRVRSRPAWRERDDMYSSTPGVGPVLRATLLAVLPE